MFFVLSFCSPVAVESSFLSHTNCVYFIVAFCNEVDNLLFGAEDFSCDVVPDGEITIKGVSTTGGRTVRKNPCIYKMLAQNLWPPGDFSITFQPPGPVNNQQFNGDFTDGIFTGVVKKR